MHAKEIAQEFERRDVAIRDLVPADYEFLCPLSPEGDRILYEWVRGSGSACFRLLDQDVDLLYVVGFNKNGLAKKASLPFAPGVQVQYVVTDIEASLALDAERRRKRKGFFGLGGRSGFEWRMGRRARHGWRRTLQARRQGSLAPWLNEDENLNDMLSGGQCGCIYVDPDLVNDCVMIWRRDLLTNPTDVAEFLAPANMIARRVRILARWGGG
jgi:hypothetical protein